MLEEDYSDFNELKPSDITSEVCQKCTATDIHCCQLALGSPPNDLQQYELFEVMMGENNPKLHHRKNGELMLTCSHLKNGQCDIYEDRPQLCRDFNCVVWTKQFGNPVHYNKVLKIKKKMDLI
jgi:Fe-S-cluster containining protein